VKSAASAVNFYPKLVYFYEFEARERRNLGTNNQALKPISHTNSAT